MCRFLARTLSKRAGKSNWMSVTEKEFVIHIINKDNGLGGVWITDEEYPQRVAFGVLNNVFSSLPLLLPIVTHGRSLSSLGGGRDEKESEMK